MELKKESIHEFYQQWFGAMENADVEGFLSLIADDFYLKGPNQPAITSKGSLRDGLQNFHRSYDETVEWNIEEINIFETIAVVRISEVVTLISKDNDETKKVEGVHFAMLKQDLDGSCKLKTDVSSLNHSPPTRS